MIRLKSFHISAIACYEPNAFEYCVRKYTNVSHFKNRYPHLIFDLTRLSEIAFFDCATIQPAIVGIFFTCFLGNQAKYQENDFILTEKYV